MNTNNIPIYHIFTPSCILTIAPPSLPTPHFSNPLR